MSLTKGLPAFTHLHLHSVYSLLDGAIRIKDLVQHVKNLGMRSVAVTDHGNMFSTIEFYEEARKHGIKPIIGCEFYVAPGSRKEKKMIEKLADGQAYHLILLAKNKQGYKNMIQLASKAYTEGFYRKPRIDYELLSQHTDGLVCLTACLAGEVNRRLYQQKTTEAHDLSGHLNELFGQGNFFLEIQDHGIPEQKEVARGAFEIHKRTGIPLVLTNDSHFLKRNDQKAQDIMLRIQMGKKEEDELEFGFNEEFYVKSSEEMKALYPDIPEAYSNTQKIDEMIELELDFGHPILPDYKTPNGESLAEYLEIKVTNGLEKRFEGKTLPESYIQRKDFELDVIRKMGYEGYFLIVADFIEFARSQHIPVGPGRGSAAGSLVAYGLGVTDVDPLEYNLLFERFLNPSRNEMPDIDIDFCRDRREEIINYVIEKYGETHVSQIITFGTLSAKAVIKDVARVLGYSFQEINPLTKNIPDLPGLSLKEAIEYAPTAKDFFTSGEKEKMFWQVALSLEGIPRNAGKHAAGVVIAPQPLDEIIPLAVDNSTGSVVSQFEKDTLEKVGLVKMDFLGLKNLTVIESAIQEIKKRKGLDLDMSRIPLDNKNVFSLLQKGYTKGIFQVEKSGITTLLIRAKPEKFDDIVACIALYRPGPLQSGMAEEYIKRKNGEIPVSYPHESLETILKDTFGTIVYQEQVMLIAQIISGFSMSDADTLRKAMGKKKMDVMAKMKEQFVAGAKEKNFDEKWSGELFDMLSKFGEYGFNKSHSVAYGLITYQTAYLKANYLIEFLKATLDADIQSTEKLIGLIHSCREMGVQILPPDINESNAYFTIIDEKTIRFGLLGLKGMGNQIVEQIVEQRGGRPFQNLPDVFRRLATSQFNKKVLEAIILSGSLDSFGFSRNSLYLAVDDILNFTQQIKRDHEQKQESLFEVNSALDESFLRLDPKEEWPDEVKLQHEKNTLGLYLTAHPLDQYKNILKETKITALDKVDDGFSSERSLTIMGVIEKIKMVKPKRGSVFYAITLSDLSDRHEIRLYNALYERVKEMIQENSVLIFDCKVNIYRESDPPMVAVMANQVYRPERMMNWIDKSLHLYLTAHSMEQLKERVTQIKKALRAHAGENPVYLHYKNHENEMQVVKAHPSYYVKYNPGLGAQIKSALNSERHIAWRVGNQLHLNGEKIPLN